MCCKNNKKKNLMHFVTIIFLIFTRKNAIHINK